MDIRKLCGSKMELGTFVTRTIWLHIDMLVIIMD